MVDVGAFAYQVKIPDAEFAASLIDIKFNAVNNNTVPVPLTDPNLLLRYKFVELLVRIAHEKFTLTKKCATVAEATDRLMTEILANWNPEPWQEYRRDTCYTLEVNDVLETNIDGITKLREAYY